MIELPNPEYFKFKDCVIGGDECILINQIDIKCKWSEATLKFRSIILRKSDHKVISSSFKKFFNYFEQPDIEPFPKGSFKAHTKHDGSTLILGYHNNEFIERTRGTANVSQLDNGYEIEFLRKKYPLLWVGVQLNPTYSVILEWETPTNYIVLRRVKEPTLTLIGIINNETLEYVPQGILDEQATAWGVERPDRHKYDSIEECVSDVETWKGLEGVVVYTYCGQFFRKIKASEYLALHKIFTGMKGISNVIDIFMESPRFTKYSDFYKHVEETIDWEIANEFKDDILKVVTAYCKVLEKIETIKHVINNVRGESFTRKDQALHIMEHYREGYRKSMAFLILDNKEIPDTLIRTAIEEMIEKL